MAAINDLIAQIQDETLRDRIQKEVDRMAKQKKFGLVFEEHLPECTPLYDIPVKKGALVMVRGGDIKELYYVRSIDNGNAECVKKDSGEEATFTVDSLVTVAQFGEPIYPYLKPIDSICNAPDSDLWHTLIEADNYHALQLLEYLYAGKVDCIYIDPPYNTGARDWKYNNDYVDGADQYRHSKWLSMMQKRLKIAKKLLNPADSVLIVTIDEKEYLHLGCLLEEMFPEANIQMVSDVINRKGAKRENQFWRTDEYIFFVIIGNASPSRLVLGNEWITAESSLSEENGFSWANMLRCGGSGFRTYSPGCFYPVYFEKDSHKFVDVGEMLPLDMHPSDVDSIPGLITIWPIHLDGSEGCWALSPENFIDHYNKGYIKFSKYNKGRLRILYIQSGAQRRIEEGEIVVKGKDDSGTIIVDTEKTVLSFVPGSQWRISSHDATYQGTLFINNILGRNKFAYPKSLYSTHDAIRFFVANKPNALIVDFFAGSGTTMHAVNLLNAEDGGHRRCILVTNNEVSEAEKKDFEARGIQPGDAEWEAKGIAHYVTWPRTVCSIKGENIKGEPLKGNYIGSDIPMSDGFKANAAFFKLGFLDKTSVALGRQFKEMLPTLWMKAGAHGACPEIGEDIPDMLILSENRFAVLVDEKHYLEFTEELDKHPEIETVFIVTDSEAGYRDMIIGMEDKNTYQLYRDYLDNFRINSQRR